ncbi:hypothetical protein Q7C18_02675 [Nesterenkonia sp. CL21]|uniref:hypothetical protein n=1 Tax=Nesterenkonia sp. CL21 TaxID=3064894 RepID=UPI002878F68F|nr:hypothetical protein [Nesterenkonia sp. CL21]MDS2171593.1 hypothetical protein [Nesterenkonia sp. CL21]
MAVLKEELEATTQAQLRKEAEAQIPKAWRARERVREDGSREIVSRPYSDADGVTEESLLRDHGYDPEHYMLPNGWKQSSWTAYRPEAYRKVSEGEDDLDAFTFTAVAYKFDVVERTSSKSDIEGLLRMIEGLPVITTLGSRNFSGGAFVHALGDPQLYKLESPVEETAQRVIDHIDMGVESYMDMGPHRPGHVHIAWLGDCIEGVVSQGGKNRWRTTGTLTEQVRVLQRLMMYAIKAYAPHCEKLTVASVPGNHDEASSRDLQTRMDDSWAVQALVSVEDAIAFSESDAFRHVECYVPGPDQQSVVQELGGAIVCQVHGHQFRIGKEYQWWQGQTFGGQPEGRATILLHGHQHHFTVEEQGQRIRIGAPALETESTWWKHKTGTPGNPGSLLLTINGGRIQYMERLTTKGDE